MSEQHKIKLEQLQAELDRVTEQALELSSRVRSVLENDVREDLLQDSPHSIESKRPLWDRSRKR